MDEVAAPARAAVPASESSAPVRQAASGDGRPSILLVVIDTVRADAVSAYGAVEGTTPVFDSLAAEGTLYGRAFAPSSWTLPSHATLFTGLGVGRHGVGVHGREALDESLVTLAERLAEAGYHTSAISENSVVSEPFGLARGFEHFSALPIDPAAGSRYDALAELESWARVGPPSPFFLFVNLYDAHFPYTVRDENLFVPEGVTSGTARSVQNPRAVGITEAVGICDRLPPRDEQAILRGLYLGDVQQADRKLGRVLEVAEGLANELVTVVVSDHGEHLGEHALMGHEFSVRNVALHVPLVVRGAADLSPGRSDVPVTLSDVAASILTWGGITVPGDFDGRPLPPPGAAAPERSIVAVYGDGPWELPEGIYFAKRDRRRRADCRPEHRVFGDLHAVTRFPFKLILTPGQPAELFDLSWDPEERSNIAAHRPELVADLQREMEEFRELTTRQDPVTPDPKALEALRALGYLD
jgi:arylsulfatase A-like enzyme